MNKHIDKDFFSDIKSDLQIESRKIRKRRFKHTVRTYATH